MLFNRPHNISAEDESKIAELIKSGTEQRAQVRLDAFLFNSRIDISPADKERLLCQFIELEQEKNDLMIFARQVIRLCQ